MGKDIIGDLRAADISTHLEEVAQLNAQNKELFARLQEILSPGELSDFLLNGLGIDTTSESDYNVGTSEAFAGR